MPHPTDFPPQFQPLLQQELQPGESITWHTQPTPRWFGPKTPGLFIGSLLLSCIMIPITAIFAPGFLFSLPRLKDPEILFPFLFCGSILLLCWSTILMLFTAPLRLFLRDKRTLYLLTNHRALIVTLNRLKPKITSLPAASLTEIYRYQHPDGSGDLILQRALYRDSDDNPHELGFESIHDVHHVETLTRQLATPNPFPPLDLPGTPFPAPDNPQPFEPAQQSLLIAELLPDETVLLPAAPDSRDRALHALIVAPLGFVVLGLGIAGVIFLEKIPPNICPLWITRMSQIFDVLLFSIIGLSALSLPFSAYQTAARTFYALTNRRIITMEQTTRGFRIWSFPPHQLHRAPPVIYNLGSLFGPPSVTLTLRTWTNPQNNETAFETLYLSNLQNFKDVEQLLRAFTSLNQESPPDPTP